MNREDFLAKLKEMRCYSDWHHRYYRTRARKYKRIDYWIKTVFGLIAILGAAIAGMGQTATIRAIGAALAGSSAFLIGTVLPNFRWDTIVSGLKEEQEEWTRIFHGYDDLLGMAEILDRDEMLALEFQKVEGLRKSAELNDRNLPDDNTLLSRLAIR